MAIQDILFVINPNSGRDRKKVSLLRRIDLYLDKTKFRPIIKFTKSPNHACELVKRHLNLGVKEFVAVGGDGTINEVAQELLNNSAVLNIIPKGSGNGLARHLGINDDERTCITRINQGNVKKIDVGLLNDIPFFCTAGIGFDAWSAQEFSKREKRGLRHYILVTLKTLFKYEPIKLTFGSVKYDVFSLTFGNASQFGNNAYITPLAVIDDGLLDSCLIKAHPKRDTIKLLIDLFQKRINKSKHVIYQRNKSFLVKSENMELIHCDGESIQLETKTIKVELLEKALSIRI